MKKKCISKILNFIITFILLLMLTRVPIIQMCVNNTLQYISPEYHDIYIEAVISFFTYLISQLIQYTFGNLRPQIRVSFYKGNNTKRNQRIKKIELVNTKQTDSNFPSKIFRVRISFKCSKLSYRVLKSTKTKIWLCISPNCFEIEKESGFILKEKSALSLKKGKYIFDLTTAFKPSQNEEYRNLNFILSCMSSGGGEIRPELISSNRIFTYLMRIYCYTQCEVLKIRSDIE